MPVKLMEFEEEIKEIEEIEEKEASSSSILTEEPFESEKKEELKIDPEKFIKQTTQEQNYFIFTEAQGSPLKL